MLQSTILKILLNLCLWSKQIKIKQPTPLHEFADIAHGVIFELPVTAIEILLNFDHNYDVYVFRHLMTFLFFSYQW